MRTKNLVPITLAAVGCLLLVSAEIEIKETQLPCERLPTHVVPTGYKLELEFESMESQYYRGQVNISLKMPHRKDEDYDLLLKGLEDEPCQVNQLGPDTIVMHADKSLNLEQINVVGEVCGLRGCFKSGPREVSIGSVRRDSEKQLIAIKLKRGVNVGSEGQLFIKFSGRLRDDKRGIYASKYSDETHSFNYIMSQFQPTDARTVFPLFDEPRFKVPFQVRIIHPSEFTALSNTGVESQRVSRQMQKSTLTETTFKETPPMPAHMVAFVIGHFDEPLEVQPNTVFSLRRNKYTLRVYTAPGKRESGRFALEVAARSLEYFEDYVDTPYPLDKFDIVAIADRDKDNTENWGLAFIRDNLVWIDEETKPDTRITTAVNVAHVCVHQWFANLITVAWWNDLWITEGVAAQFAFKIVQELYPQFESEYFVRLATLSGVMQLDAPGNQHALTPKLDELRTSEHIYEIFDNIEFMKSASLAQMIDNWMGSQRDDWYRRFLRKLVKAQSYMTVTRWEYMLAMEYTVLDFIGDHEKTIIPYMMKLVESFGAIHGVPLVNAKLVDDKMKIDLELMHSARKDIMSPDEKQSQLVMIHDRLRQKFVEPLDHRNQRRSKWSVFTSEHAWVVDAKDTIWNKMSRRPDISTYYRTRYSPNAYQALCEPISKRELSAMDRLQLLDDANVLAQVHLITGDTFRQLVDCFADEDNGAVLIELMVALKTLAGQQLSSTSSKAVLNIFEEDGFAVTGSETFLEQRSRAVALKALITQGNQQVIEAALEKFDEGDIALFLREAVYTAVALHGAKAQVEQLQAKLEKTSSYEERLRLANALSLSGDKQVLANLENWLTHKSFLNKDTLKPILDLIEPKLK